MAPPKMIVADGTPSPQRQQLITSFITRTPPKQATSHNIDAPEAAFKAPKSMDEPSKINTSRKRVKSRAFESAASSSDSSSTDNPSKKLKIENNEGEPGPDLNKKPISALREMVQHMIISAKPLGLDHYIRSGNQFFIRVGTLCSGTDAPLHMLNLFGMLKNDAGEQVFTTINAFACEIEPFKQGFLQRNSKPNLLFRDARDFTKTGANRAHLVSGVETDIPEVDIFIAGTSCVDFSNLNTRKSKDFESLKKSNTDWRQLFQQRGDGQLSKGDIDDAEWQSFIRSMLQDSDKRTSTTTFAAAINYLRERQPKIVIFENVETAPWESTADYVFPLSGYSVKIMKLDTKHYYLPQTRSRKYVIGFNHKFFGVEVARALCGKIASNLEALKYSYSCNVTDFLLPVGSIELHRARNEMELTALSAQERDVDWSFSKSRHETFRDTHNLGDSRPWIQWRENGNSNAPDRMWKPWEARQPNRVSDLLDCAHLAGTKGKIPKHGAYDLRQKAQIIDCSQNVDRVNLGPEFGITNCLTPNAIPVLTLEARPITGSEALKLQGMPIENFDMSVETQAQLQDLAGNAMTTTVVGATLLSSLSCIAQYSFEKNLGWLPMLFPRGDYQEKFDRDTNSYKAHASQLGEFSNEECVVLSRLFQADQSVSKIIDLGSMTRRRCVCYHVLAYSSMELYVCKVCGASLCKSCKGNPEHQLVKSVQSFEDLGCLSFAEAEFRLREFFPPILPMLSNIDYSKVAALNQVLLRNQSAIYPANEAEVLANETLAGLCSTVYELKFIETTDITRIQYVSEDKFMLQVNIECEQIVWYLHLDQWSEAAKKLRGKHKTSEPIARAILGPDADCQFPTTWEPWIAHNLEFNLSFRLEGGSSLRLVSSGVGGVTMNKDLQDNIMRLDNSVWIKHEECGFAEFAFWVTTVGGQKFFLFKDVNPIGTASMDEFVITTVSRDMGRTPVAETRSVLLRISYDYQLHQIIENMALGSEFVVPGYVTGWWLRGEEASISIPDCWREGNLAEQRFPRSLPVRIQNASHGPSLVSHSDESPCSRDQILLEMSLPIFGASRNAVEKTLETLRDLDMAQQLDRAEFVRIIGPCYLAVERHIMLSRKGCRILQLWEVELGEDCEACAPRLPSPIWERHRAPGSRSQGPVMARYHEADQQGYESNLRKQPIAFRIDHNVNAALSSQHNKDPRFSYVDVRLVGRAHTLLQQARSFLPKHPDFHMDTVATKGTFSMEFCVLEDPRPDLAPIRIQPPRYNKKTARHPTGFRQDVRLFDEQLASLEWMITRENNDDETHFVEREVAEVYVDHLRFRLFAQSARQITRRGRVVADSVGFGKTAVCFGLIDRQHHVDRDTFLDLRTKDPSLEDMIHLQATLVVVPNQLTEQWKKEGERFLNAGYRIIVISTFTDLQMIGIAGLKEADIVICSNKIFQDRKYSSLLFEICGSGQLSLNNITDSPKVYRDWYKTALKIISSVRKLMIKVLADPHDRQDYLDELRRRLKELREQGTTESRLAFIPSSGVAELRPMVLLELFSFARVIWDEFPYKNLPVTEFVANCPTVSKWMLSGTTPIDSLGDIAKVAYLFNVHLARPLALVGGRQPCVCENPPLEPLSEIEQTAMYHSRYSPSLLKERHTVALDFVRKFMRKNIRVVSVKSVTKPVVLSSLSNARIAYLELQQELNNRTFNANRASAEVRNRLMSRISWKGSRLGTERAMEALMLRASSSYNDVRDSLAGKDLPNTASVAEIADRLHEGCLKTIQDMEDRGRELLGKAFYLAYRLAFVNVKKHAKKDNGEDRQFDYYEKLHRIVNSILDVNVKQFSGWDAYESALRILIWDDELCEKLGSINDGEEPLTGLPSTSNPGAWENVVRKYWDQMSFCDLPKQMSEPEDKIRAKILMKKQQWLSTFTEYLSKTPLHSRRWFYAHKLDSSGSKDAVDMPLVKSLLEMEWRSKVPWERKFREAKGDNTSDLVPIRDLFKSASLPTDEAYTLELLECKDAAREAELAGTKPETRASLIQEVQAKHPYTRLSKAHWQEECGQRGLVFKSTESVSRLQGRLCLAIENKATEKDYITPGGCPLQVAEIPVEGKKRIRGSEMEPIFDQLMNTIDKLLDHLGRLPELYGKRNLQEVIAQVARCTWRCDEHSGGNALQTHCVSLACGHVHCSRSNDPMSMVCGIRGCTALIKNNTCVLLSKLSEEPRTILATDFDEGALRKDPAVYLDEEDESQSPKALAIVNLINATAKSDQVVVFVQNINIQNDVYKALASIRPKINHVTAEDLKRNEAGALEAFKAGHDDDLPLTKMKKVLVQTINSEQAAGSNLHNANHIIFVSPLVTRNQREWDAQMQQALGRCVRYRQQKTVHVYHFVVDETIEADTLEWRLKKDILVRPGRAVGRFREGTVPEFLERFDEDEQRGVGEEYRAVSMLSRDDVQFLMGDDYISVAAARSTKTVESARAAALEEETDAAELAATTAEETVAEETVAEKNDAQMADAEEDVAFEKSGSDVQMTGA